MNFLLIFGPPAVGKMTVAYEVEKLTEYKVFHNHVTIEFVLKYFDYGHPSFGKLVNDFRERIFEEVSVSDMSGFIFTYVWALNLPEEKDNLEKIFDIFREKGASIYIVELEASLEERLVRNRSEFRLEEKPSKRNIKLSEEHLLEVVEKYKYNSDEEFIDQKNYLKIENTDLSPQNVAKQIVEKFNF